MIYQSPARTCYETSSWYLPGGSIWDARRQCWGLNIGVVSWGLGMPTVAGLLWPQHNTLNQVCHICLWHFPFPPSSRTGRQRRQNAELSWRPRVLPPPGHFAGPRLPLLTWVLLIGERAHKKLLNTLHWLPFDLETIPKPSTMPVGLPFRISSPIPSTHVWPH